MPSNPAERRTRKLTRRQTEKKQTKEQRKEIKKEAKIKKLRTKGKREKFDWTCIWIRLLSLSQCTFKTIFRLTSKNEQWG